MKVCRTCGVSKHIDDYYLTRAGSPYPDCKKCRNKKTTERKRSQKKKRRTKEYKKKDYFVATKVPCYNAPDCKVTVTVAIIEGEKPPRKICNECRKNGPPSDRIVHAGYSGAFTNDLADTHKWKCTSGVKHLSKKEIARIKHQITPLHPDLRVV